MLWKKHQINKQWQTCVYSCVRTHQKVSPLRPSGQCSLASSGRQRCRVFPRCPPGCAGRPSTAWRSRHLPRCTWKWPQLEMFFGIRVSMCIKQTLGVYLSGYYGYLMISMDAVFGCIWRIFGPCIYSFMISWGLIWENQQSHYLAGQIREVYLVGKGDQHLDLEVRNLRHFYTFPFSCWFCMILYDHHFPTPVATGWLNGTFFFHWPQKRRQRGQRKGCRAAQWPSERYLLHCAAEPSSKAVHLTVGSGLKPLAVGKDFWCNNARAAIVGNGDIISYFDASVHVCYEVIPNPPMDQWKTFLEAHMGEKRTVRCSCTMSSCGTKPRKFLISAMLPNENRLMDRKQWENVVVENKWLSFGIYHIV